MIGTILFIFITNKLFEIEKNNEGLKTPDTERIEK